MSGNLAEILLRANLPPERIRVETTGERLRYPTEIRARIDELWQKKVEESRQKGSPLWDGENYHLLGCYFDGENLMLRLGLAKYRDVAFRFYPPELVEAMHASRGDAPGIGLFVAGLVRTADGFFVFGERSSAYLNQEGRIDLLGGTLQPDDGIVRDARTLYDGLLRELAEEAGMRRGYLSEPRFVGLVRSARGNPGLIFRLDTRRTRVEADADFQASNDAEMRTLAFASSAGELRDLSSDPTIELYARLIE